MTMRYEDTPMAEIETPDPTLTPDQDALRRAFLLTMKQPGRAKQLYAHLNEDDYAQGAADACSFAAFHQQVQNLSLPPWELPPCCIGGDEARISPEIMAIGDRLLKAGLSLYEPDPLEALAKAEAK
jgi:hypothetical protein